MHHGIGHIVEEPCWTSDPGTYLTPPLPTSDIWWWSLETCSNYPWKQHLVVATETGPMHGFQVGGTNPTGMLACSLLVYFSFHLFEVGEK